MALRTAMSKNMKGITTLLGKNRGMGTMTGTIPKLKAYAPSLGEEGTLGTIKQRKSLKEELLPKGKPLGEYVPVYVALGMISLSVSVGLYTAKQELFHGPDVRVKKSRRETLPEVVEPDYVARESEEFIKKSFFRKLAHIQEFNQTPIPDSIHGNPLTKEPRVESLKTVGIDPVVDGPSKS